MQAVRGERAPVLLPVATVGVLRTVFGLRSDADVSEMIVGEPHVDARLAAAPALRTLAASSGSTARECARAEPDDTLEDVLDRFAARTWHGVVLLVLDVGRGGIGVARCGSPAFNRTSLLTLLRCGATYRLVYPVPPLLTLPSPIVDRGTLFEIVGGDRRRLAAGARKR